jgi:hypothetical protein
VIRSRLGLAFVILVALASLLIAEPALACSVCLGGDTSDAMNQGLRAGMLVLLGVVGVVLTGLASLFLFWVRRASHIAAQVRVVEAARHAVASD